MDNNKLLGIIEEDDENEGDFGYAMRVTQQKVKKEIWS